jgi:putative methionine-R-sulfoxide reductase with GAF domain
LEMFGSSHPEDRSFEDQSVEDPSIEDHPDEDRSVEDGSKEHSVTDKSLSSDPIGESSRDKNVFDEAELNTALQLLVERAQYITGATGTALALPEGDEMVCRASAGSSAPVVGASLQVRSGITGESIARRQLLRCDNAENDPRVNLEACRALGIASIVVLPLMRPNGEVRGLFELFSDHPYAFEERDLVALERMADLTLTALDLAEQRQSSVSVEISPKIPSKEEKKIEATPASDLPEVVKAAPDSDSNGIVLPDSSLRPDLAEAPVSQVESLGTPAPLVEIPTTTFESPRVMSDGTSAATAPALLPDAMHHGQKCAACGFPVSEGRTLCLDCEKLDAGKLESKAREKNAALEQDKTEPEVIETQEEPREELEIESLEVAHNSHDQDGARDLVEDAPASPDGEFVPAFLANSVPVKKGFLSNPVNLLAIIVLILSILVAVVVFR